MTATRKPKPQRVTQEQISLPVGTPVNVKQDDGTYKRTRTRSAPWQLGHGTWVVSLDGVSGGYDLERVSPA